MHKKKLLDIPVLCATPTMLKCARENPVKTTYRKRYYFGGTYTDKRYTCKYKKYFRTEIVDGILAVYMYLQTELEHNDKTPKYIIFCDRDKKEYLTYEYGEDKWRTAKIDNLETGIYCYGQTLNWQQAKDRKLVNTYFGTGKNRDIYEAVLDFQADIGREKLKRKHRSEIEQIDEVMREVPELPNGFEKWVRRNAFPEMIFYEPNGKQSKMYCTSCGRFMERKLYRNGRITHNMNGRCPKCRADVTFKGWNKQKYIAERAEVGILQRLNDDSGWILRRFSCFITRNHADWWQKYDLDVHEDVRITLSSSFRQQTWFEWGEYKYTRVYRWCYYVNHGSIYGNYQDFGNVIMYTPNLKKLLKDEKFAGVDFKGIFEAGKKTYMRPAEVLNKLYRYPMIEYIQKSRLKTLTAEVMAHENINNYCYFNSAKTRLHEVFGIDKQRFNRLKYLDGGFRSLKLLKHEIDTGEKIPDEMIRYIEKEKLDVRQIIMLAVRTEMTVHRLVNYLKKQMVINDKDFSWVCSHYSDYLDLAQIFDMDITDDIIRRQPKMMEYHDIYVKRRNKNKNAARDKEVDIKYPGIKEKSGEYGERFGFSTKEFEIVVPATASDITKEGRQQNHCVGSSDRYLIKMENRQTFILFLRRKRNLKKPYYTLEVDWNGNILQFYAAFDRQPDKEKIEKVLNKFTKTVQDRKFKSQEIMQEVMAPVAI